MHPWESLTSRMRRCRIWDNMLIRCRVWTIRMNPVCYGLFSCTTRWRVSVDVLITGSWDRTLKFWDPRSSTAQQSSHDLPERVYQMDLTRNTLVVSMASRLFHIYDIRKMDSPAQERESSLKFMTRSLACMVDGQGKWRDSCRWLPLASPSFIPTAFHLLPHFSCRLCNSIYRRSHSSRILWPFPCLPISKIRFQSPPPNDRWDRPRLARERPRFSPHSQYVRFWWFG